jgi:hypothetical protein
MVSPKCLKMGRRMLVNVSYKVQCVFIKKYSETSVIPKIIQNLTSVVPIKIRNPTSTLPAISP